MEKYYSEYKLIKFFLYVQSVVSLGAPSLSKPYCYSIIDHMLYLHLCIDSSLSMTL